MRLSEWIHDDLKEVQAILALVSDESAEEMVRAILAAQRVYVLGLGRSGLILRMFAMRLMQIGLNAHVVGDATTPAIGKGDLLLTLSGSGRTETVVAMARKAKSYGAQVLAITSNPATPLAELADMTLIAPARSVKIDVTAPTRLPLANALEQAMAIVLDCIGAMLAERCGQDNAAMMHRHANLE
ncbi:MAG: 3-hexulose-6-phosphate isomerase [Chloroflexota bacterium]|nr:SIS domain-containing protein [Caldilinea sp.]GIK74202.1 MAG: 3-hexulose-6-phosphate isomerase [Chloroflexota bacterium]